MGLESVNSDLITMFLGQKIGSGSYRSVYEFNPNPQKYVVKIEPLSTDCNSNEFLIWNEISWLKGELSCVKNWFAPVLWMSPNAKVLIMERTFEKSNLTRPDKIPDFMTDIKFENYGWIGNKFVCHDYGFLSRFIEYKKKLRKANW